MERKNPENVLFKRFDTVLSVKSTLLTINYNICIKQWYNKIFQVKIVFNAGYEWLHVDI